MLFCLKLSKSYPTRTLSMKNFLLSSTIQNYYHKILKLIVDLCFASALMILITKFVFGSEHLCFGIWHILTLFLYFLLYFWAAVPHKAENESVTQWTPVLVKVGTLMMYTISLAQVLPFAELSHHWWGKILWLGGVYYFLPVLQGFLTLMTASYFHSDSRPVI